MYCQKPFAYEIFTPASPDRRQRFEVSRPSFHGPALTGARGGAGKSESRDPKPEGSPKSEGLEDVSLTARGVSQGWELWQVGQN